MSMEPVLLGVAAPAIVSGASKVGRAVAAVTQPFRSALNAAGHLLTTETNSPSHFQTAVPSPEQVPDDGDPRFALLSELLAGKSSTGNSTSLTREDVLSHASKLQADIEERIQDALARAGIKLESPLRLEVSNLDGTIEVSGIHSQSAVIEAALNSDPTLASDIQKLSAERDFLDLHARSKRLAKDFAAEPWRTIAAQAGQEDQRHEVLLEVTNKNDRLQLRFD